MSDSKTSEIVSLVVRPEADKHVYGLLNASASAAEKAALSKEAAAVRAKQQLWHDESH